MKTFQKTVLAMMFVLLLIPAGIVSAQTAGETIPQIVKPVLLAPRDGAMPFAQKSDLVWKRVQGAIRYEVQLTSAKDWDPAPEELMDISFVPTDLTLPVVQFRAPDYPGDGMDWLTPNRFYRWHVRACSSDTESDCGLWSATRKFLPRYVQTDKPQLITPENGVTVDSLTPSFEWDRLPNDSSYEVEITGPGNIRRHIVKPTEGGSTAVFTPISSFRGITTFQWRVRAIGYRGYYRGPWSDTFTFTTPPNPAPVPPIPHQVKLVLPRNNAIRDELQPNLVWYRVSGAVRYQVQLSSSEIWDPSPAEMMSVNFVPGNLTKVLVTFQSTDYATQLDWLTPNRPYYWRVRACPDALDDNNCYAWSNTRHFIPRYTINDRPILVGPGGLDGSVTIDTLTPNFVWNRVPNDQRYEVVVANGKGVWRYWYEATGSDPMAHFTMPAALAEGRTYWWRVRAAGYRGWVMGPWSEQFYFTTPLSTPAP